MTEPESWWTPLTLGGPTLTLSPMRLQDAPDYLRALGSAEESAQVVQHLTFRPPADLAEARLIISAAVGDASRMPYVQRITETGELVGTTSFYEIDPVLRSIAIGHTWIARRFWRTGVNTESKLIMMSRAFEGLGVRAPGLAHRYPQHPFPGRDRTARGATRGGAAAPPDPPGRQLAGHRAVRDAPRGVAGGQSTAARPAGQLRPASATSGCGDRGHPQPVATEFDLGQPVDHLAIPGPPVADRIVADPGQHVQRLRRHGAQREQVEIGRGVDELLRGASLAIEADPPRQPERHHHGDRDQEHQPADDQREPLDAVHLMVGRDDQVAHRHRRRIEGLRSCSPTPGTFAAWSAASVKSPASRAAVRAVSRAGVASTPIVELMKTPISPQTTPQVSTKTSASTWPISRFGRDA